MTNDEMIAQLDIATKSILTVRTALGGVVGDVINVNAGASLQAAVDAAKPGSKLVLDDAVFAQPQLTVAKSLTFTRKNPVPPGRATATAPCTILGSTNDAAIAVPGDLVTFLGVGIGNVNKDGELVNVMGNDTVFDRITGLGDPKLGLHRGIRLHGNRTKIVQSFFDHIFAVGRDSCVLGGWDGGNDIKVDDSWLCGGAETIMFGGADSKSPDRIPQNIEITKSVLTKRVEWFGMGVQIKNAFELKSARNVHMADCILEYAGIAEGQGAFLFVMTPRNQSGTAPWSTIEKVLIERCTARFGGGGISFLGNDNNQPSGTLTDVTFRNIKFTDIDPLGITKGNARLLQFDRGPKNVTIDGITAEAKNMQALGYFANTPGQPVGLTLQNINYANCPSKYGWKIDAGGLDIPPASKNLKLLMPDLVYNVSGQDVGAIGAPTG